MKAALRLTILAGLCVIPISGAFAGDPSDPSNPSVGTSDLEITVNETAMITGMADITETYAANANSGINVDEDVCIYSNDSGSTPPKYKVTATGDGAASAFTVTDGTNTIAYAVDWNNATGAGVISLATGDEEGPYDATNTFPCVADNANYEVKFTDSDIRNKPAGVYAGTLTISIIPDDT